MPRTNNPNPTQPSAGGGAAPAASQADLKQLLADMKAAKKDDGSVELAMAIAAVSSKVTVTASPLGVNPPELFELTFDHPKVGITDAQMQSVKSNLTVLLPEIAADIATIPNNAHAGIEDAQEFIRIALLKASRR